MYWASSHLRPTYDHSQALHLLSCVDGYGVSVSVSANFECGQHVRNFTSQPGIALTTCTVSKLSRRCINDIVFSQFTTPKAWQCVHRSN